jgi:hypothetical protein
MSRVLFLKLAEKDVVAKCDAASVGISALESLPDGGTRLVCQSSAGAALMQTKLKSSLIKDDARRERFRPLYTRQ